MRGGRTMEQYSEAFVGIDTAKNKHALAIADPGRDGEIRYLGEIDSAPAAVQRMIRKLAGRYEKLYFCYEAGPTGYGLYRQVRALGHDCIVVAPSLVPKRPGERVKTNRRDAVTLARLLRAGDLTPVWVPDAGHEAVRDLVRARTAASEDLRRKRQQLLSFLLRHGRIYSGRKHWTKLHLHWLAQQKFDHPAQQIVFQDAVDAIEDAATRLRRLDQQVAEIVPSWSMAPVVEAYQAMRGVSFGVAVTIVAEIGDFATVRQSAPADGLSRPGAIRAVDWRAGSACRSHTGRQQTCPAGTDRGCLELPVSGPRQPNLAGAARGAAQNRSRHRLEGANSPVRPLPSAHRRRQKASVGHCSNCPRNGGVSVGARATRRARGMIASPANDPDKTQVALVRLSSVFESATPVTADPAGRC